MGNTNPKEVGGGGGGVTWSSLCGLYETTHGDVMMMSLVEKKVSEQPLGAFDSLACHIWILVAGYVFSD